MERNEIQFFDRSRRLGRRLTSSTPLVAGGHRHVRDLEIGGFASDIGFASDRS